MLHLDILIMAARDLVAEIAALSITAPVLDISNFASTTIGVPKDVQIEKIGATFHDKAGNQYICDVERQGNTLYISRAVTVMKNITIILVLDRSIPVSWSYYIGDNLITEIRYAPYMYRRFLKYTTEIATNVDRTQWQISSNDGCWVQICGEYNQFILFYNDREYIFECIGSPSLHPGTTLGASGTYSRDGEVLKITTYCFNIVEIRAMIEGALRIWTPANKWQTE